MLKQATILIGCEPYHVSPKVTATKSNTSASDFWGGLAAPFTHFMASPAIKARRPKQSRATALRPGTRFAVKHNC